MHTLQSNLLLNNTENQYNNKHRIDINIDRAITPTEEKEPNKPGRNIGSAAIN